MYNLLKFVHVLAIAVWVGGAFTVLFLSRRFSAAGEPALMRALGREAAALSKFVFMPAALVALITGIGAVQAGNLSFGAPWVSAGFLGLIASIVVGGVVTGGTARKLAARIADGSANPEYVAAAQRRIALYGTINLLILTVTVWFMVAKP